MRSWYMFGPRALNRPEPVAADRLVALLRAAEFAVQDLLADPAKALA